jgi:Methyltransferase domain
VSIVNWPSSRGSSHRCFPTADSIWCMLSSLRLSIEIKGAYAQRIPSDSNGDGPKWVCDPHRIARKTDCLVYSVGSNGNTMFEEGIKREIGEHCEIHTFDMVTFNRRNGHFQPKLEATGAHFHGWGLGTQEQADEYKKTNRGVPMHTLKQTMEILNHTGRVLDIFKIDCEWCEWHTYEEWLQAGDLRQILVETHNAPMPNAMNFFYTLHDAGYVIFSKEANFVNRAGGVEYSFLKLSTEFFVDDSMYSKRTLAKPANQ